MNALTVDQPLVSVVMPSFNQGLFIEESISSVMTQSYSRLELIVMDGGSDDDTLQVLNRIGRDDKRLRWVSELDSGPAHAINKAISMARGTVLGWLNSDDLYESGSIERAVAELYRNNNLVMVYGRANHVDEVGAYLNNYPTLTPDVGRSALANGCFICQPTIFLKKSAVNLLGPLDQDLTCSFDFDWWFRAFTLFDDRIGFVNRVQASSRLHVNCITNKQRALVAVEGMYLIKKHMGWLDTRWAISYFNEMVKVKNFTSKEALWINFYEHLIKKMDLSDIEILRKTFCNLRF